MSFSIFTSVYMTKRHL